MADAQTPGEERASAALPAKAEPASGTAAANAPTPEQPSAAAAEGARKQRVKRAANREATSSGPRRKADNHRQAKAGAKDGATPEAAGKSAASARRSAPPKKSAAPDPITMLKDDHRKVEGLFASFETAPNRARKQKIVAEICTALKLHAELEEQVFYPATRDHCDKDDKLDEAQVEHDTVKLLIADLEGAAPGTPFHAAKVKVLSEYVRHHVAEEEAPDGILEAARNGGVDLAQVGEQMKRLREQLESDPSQLRLRTTALGSASNASQRKESNMARQNGNGEYRDAMRGSNGSPGGGRDYDDRAYGRSRRERDGHGAFGMHEPSRSGRAGSERPRRGGGAEGFNEASRRAAEREAHEGRTNASATSGRGQSQAATGIEPRRARRIGPAGEPAEGSGGGGRREEPTTRARSREGENGMRGSIRGWQADERRQSGHGRRGPESRH